MKTWRVQVMPSGNGRLYQGDRIEEKWTEIGKWVRSQGWGREVAQITVTLIGSDAGCKRTAPEDTELEIRQMAIEDEQGISSMCNEGGCGC